MVAWLDAVHIGGGLSRELFDSAWSRLRPLGWLVANADTPETEAVLSDLHGAYGGDLVRLAVERAEAVAGEPRWRALEPVMQWSMVKR